MVDLGETKKVSQVDGRGVPFPAVVGQERLKEALLVVGANDDLDGLLVRGEKGTAKSTAARALTGLLPDQRAVADCPYGCPPDDGARQCARCRERTDPPVETRPVPFVTLPLGAARERVVGSLSVADALDGSAEFNPGLLARANRGVLYVDEVNLLDDHLVDVLLDAAASGVNRVERDGVSVAHPADVTLVGTMNPEEGDLRPQFRDRFALQAAVTGAADLDERVTVIERALSGFDGDYAEETAAASERLRDARDRLPTVTLPDSLARDLAELCRDAGVEGHRADIAAARAARTLAALDGRTRVTEPDLRRGAELALPHRLQSRPFEDAPDAGEVVDDYFEDGEDGSDPESGDAGETDDGAGDGEGEENGTARDGAGENRDRNRDGETGDGEGDNERRAPGSAGRDGAAAPTTDDASGENGDRDGERESDATDDGEEGDGREEPAEASPLVPGQPRGEPTDPGSAAAPDLGAPTAERPGTAGRARATPSSDGRGPRVGTEAARDGTDIDAAATVRAAARRGGECVERRDLRRSVRAGESGALVVFAVDASASMRGPMRAAKGVALDLLRDAYEHRDEVAVVTFAGESADVVLPPTDSVALAARHLKSLPTGDRTPLPAGLEAVDEVLARADPAAAVVVVVTDGRANAGSESPTADTRAAAGALADRGARVLVVDASGGDGGDRRTLIPDLVTAADGVRVPLSELTPDRVAGAVRETSGSVDWE